MAATLRLNAHARRRFMAATPRLNAHAQLAHVLVSNDDSLTRQRIQHFVRDNHTSNGLRGKRIEPHHAVAQLGRQLLDARALAITQIRAHFENGVPLRQRIQRRKRSQHRRSHPARAGAQLDHGAARLPQHLGNLARDTLTEQIRHFGRGSEIPAAPDLHATGAVVAEPRRIQRQLHELIERQPAARRLDALADVSRHRARMHFFFGRHRRER
ncbi:MAG: hypothetical protein WDO68_13080 [Gammaproteobacteria bacterium]